MKKFIIIVFWSLLSLNLIHAGCGSCNVSSKKAAVPAAGEFVTTISDDGTVKGLVLASCGMCNFGMKNQKHCSLAIQVNEQSYGVKGTGIEDHGGSHAKDGFCNAIRVASVSGTVKDGLFLAESFELQKN
jgi:hypothetical protein